MKLLGIGTLILSVVGTAAELVGGVANLPEPVWIAIWGFALLGLSSTFSRAMKLRRTAPRVSGASAARGAKLPAISGSLPRAI